MSVSELLDADAWDVAEAVRDGRVSAAEVLDATLERLHADTLGAVWLVTEHRARREAVAVDAAIAAGRDPGPLAGVPVGWKDLIDTAGIRTTYGSAIYADHVPDRDADVVAGLSAAGAVCVAKLATHEFAWGTTTDNPHFGTCHNPVDPGRLPGGSSGGSGAAVGARMVPLAPGTDTGGSIRCPASCCGIVGLKPTFGRVSLAGIHPLCISLDHCGPMARSVRDCARSLEVMAGRAIADPRTVPVDVENYAEAMKRGVEGRTVAVAERFFMEHTAPDIAARVREAVDVLAAAGARVTEIDLEWPVEGTVDGEGFYLAEEAAALARLWPVERDRLGKDVVAALEAADRMNGVTAARLGLLKLQYAARMLEKMAAARVDMIVTATQAFTPPPLGTRRVPFGGHDSVDVTSAMCALTGVFNVLGWPAVSVPHGRDDAGMPVGVQIAALPWRESDCLAAAAVIESAAR